MSKARSRSGSVRQPAGRRSAIPAGDLPAGVVPGVEMRQLAGQDRRLDRVEPLVVARVEMLALVALAEVAPAPREVGELVVVGADHPAVAEGAEVLARVEAERPGAAEGAGGALAPTGPVRLSGVLEEEQIAFAGEGRRRVHVADLPVEVDHHQRRRPGPDHPRG